MITDDSPLPLPGASRIPFALASPLQVSQALAYAMERLAAHFPTLDWTMWSETFRYVQPELVVQGPVVGLKWPVLVRLVQRLASSVDYPALDSPVCEPAAAESAEQITAYQESALQALAQLAETLEGCSPLFFELAATLAKGHAIAARVYAATYASANEKRNRPDPLVLDKRLASAAKSLQAVDSPATWGLLNPVASVPASPALEQTPDRSLSTTRRTFRDIVQHHPRANGKMGFTVRELCRAMRISAVSLREAHANPGRLSLNAVRALAILMQESLLLVLADLLAEVEAKKKRRK